MSEVTLTLIDMPPIAPLHSPRSSEGRYPRPIATDAERASLCFDPILRGLLVDRDDGPYFDDTTLVVRRLGAGGTASVYLAYDDTHQRPIALKICPLDGSPEDARVAVERFRRESGVGRTVLEHPNLARTYSAGIKANVLFGKQEFIDGIRLDRLVRREGPMEPRRAVRIAIDVASALSAVHPHVVHRDVKPHNIIVRPDGRAVLIDFGCMKLMSTCGKNLTKVGSVIGTPAFMSPEQVCDSAAATPQTDVFGAAATLAFTLTGEESVKGVSAEQIMVNVASRRFPLLNPKLAGKALAAVVSRGTAFSPAERFRDGGEWRDALVSTLPHIRGSTLSLGQKDRLRLKVRPVVAAAIALALIGTCLIVRPNRMRSRAAAVAAQTVYRVDTASGTPFLHIDVPPSSKSRDFSWTLDHVADAVGETRLCGLVLRVRGAGRVRTRLGGDAEERVDAESAGWINLSDQWQEIHLRLPPKSTGRIRSSVLTLQVDSTTVNQSSSVDLGSLSICRDSRF